MSKHASESPDPISSVKKQRLITCAVPDCGKKANTACNTSNWHYPERFNFIKDTPIIIPDVCYTPMCDEHGNGKWGKEGCSRCKRGCPGCLVPCWFCNNDPLKGGHPYSQKYCAHCARVDWEERTNCPSCDMEFMDDFTAPLMEKVPESEENWKDFDQDQKNFYGSYEKYCKILNEERKEKLVEVRREFEEFMAERKKEYEDQMEEEESEEEEE